MHVGGIVQHEAATAPHDEHLPSRFEDYLGFRRALVYEPAFTHGLQQDP